MTTEELKHYYSIYYMNFGVEGWAIYRELGFENKFFTKQETSTYITEHPNQFEGLILTILEIFEQ